MIRLFISSDQIRNSAITSDSEWFHYLTAVIRVKVGERAGLVIDEKQLCEIRITAITRTEVRFETLSTQPIGAGNGINVTLFQALPRQDKFSEIINTVTQLGVMNIYPLLTARVEVRYNESKTKRWQQILLQASMQSRRTSIPKLQGPLKIDSLNETIADIAAADLKLVFWEDSAAPLKPALKAFKKSAGSLPYRIAIVIGPEGGLTHEEVQKLESNGFKSVSLGPTILRVENAACVALTAINYELAY